VEAIKAKCGPKWYRMGAVPRLVRHRLSPKHGHLLSEGCRQKP
jgi:hypothetical protein